MIKKLVLLSVGAVAAVALVSTVVGRGSVHTMFKKAHNAIEAQVSPEFELERIRDQIAQLGPDMHKNISRIAEQMVAVEALERDVQTCQVNLDKRKTSLLAMTNALETGDTQRVKFYGGASDLKRRLERELKTYKTCDKELAGKQKILEAKKQELDTARAQLSEIKEQKAQLESLVAQYEAELATLRLEQTRSKFKLDDSRLGDIKGAFENLRQKIDVERKKIELSGQYFPEATFTGPTKEEPSSKDIASEVRATLGEPAKERVSTNGVEN
jgi:chromosome segregation ATPase